ncbi:MAG: hypothetical protein KDD60_09990 [Bdellovibrionales bacterium]|nr:hypothetical protein [Bdellovibrionales bacterium]
MLAGCVPQLPNSPSLDQQHRAAELLDSGTLLLRRAALDEAYGAFEVSYELDPSAAALDGIGCVAFLRGELIQARDYFLAANELEPEYAPSLGHLALIYELLGQSGVPGAKEASEILHRRAIALAPEDGILRNNRAVSLGSDGRYSTASREIFRAFAVLPHAIVDTNLQKIEEERRHD